MSDCTICHHPAGDGLYACHRCTHRIRAWLTEIPRQLPLLAAGLERGASPRTGTRFGGRGPGLPLRVDALNLTGPGNPTPPTDDRDSTGPIPIAPLLYGWAGYIATHHPAVTRDPHGTIRIQPCTAAIPCHGHTITGWCHWLTAYLPYAARHPWIAHLHAQLGDVIDAARAITRATPMRHPRAAPCPTCAAFDLAVIDGEWGVSCGACGTHLTPEEYAAHAATVLTEQQQEPA